MGSYIHVNRALDTKTKCSGFDKIAAKDKCYYINCIFYLVDLVILLLERKI